MILMSPPCQPFTRVGLKKDVEDIRSKPFLHILSVLESMKKPPDYLLLENVKGFEVSDARDLLIKTMENRGYNIQEFLLTPLQFGIPNARLRYYFLAKRKPLEFCFETRNEVWEELPAFCECFVNHRVECEGLSKTELSSPEQETNGSNNSSSNAEENSQERLGWMGLCRKCHFSNIAELETSSCSPCDLDCLGTTLNSLIGCSHSLGKEPLSLGKDASAKGALPVNSTLDGENMEDLFAHEIVEKDLLKYTRHCRPLEDYLEPGDTEYFKEFCVSDEKLKHLGVSDLVKPTERKCNCFTKSYGHHMNGTGSILQQGPDPSLGTDLKKKDLSESEWESARQLQLRFFTPREIARIMCFPQDYKFPDNFTKQRCYRVLGNSLNVHVCATLVRLLVTPEITG